MGVCWRGYRGIFWSVFIRGKYTPERMEWVGWRGVKKLFIDRLGREGVVVLAANRRDIDEIVGN